MGVLLYQFETLDCTFGAFVLNWVNCLCLMSIFEFLVRAKATKICFCYACNGKLIACHHPTETLDGN